MRKMICLFLCFVLILLASVAAFADTQEPEITFHPQTYDVPEYDVAEYVVKAEGRNLKATWYMQWQGKTYNISQTGGSVKPWEAYAGETYGAVQTDSNTFTFFFGEIEDELDGAEIWCVLEDGHYDVTTQRAKIMVHSQESRGYPRTPPLILSVPASLTVEQGQEAEIRCVARSQDGSQLSFLWYETDTGKLEDMRALNRGTENCDFLFCDTSQPGVRQYICRVETSNGGIAYSSVVPVEVKAAKTQPKPTAPPVVQTEPPVVEPEPPVAQTEAPAPEEITLETTAPTETETLETAQPTQAPSNNIEEPAPQDDGLPWWVLVAVALGGCAIGIGVAVILIHTNKKTK